MGGWVLRTVLLRCRSHAAVLGVAALVCLVAATLLSALAIQVSAVARSGVPTQLREAPVERTTIETTLELDGKPPAPAEAALAAGISEALGGLASTRTTKLVSVPAAVTEPPAAGGNPLGSVIWYAAYDGLSARTRLVSGRWPGPVTAGRVEVAVPEAMATDLGLRPGSRFHSDNLAGGRKNDVTVVGVFRPVRPLDQRYWADDPLRGAAHDPRAPIPFVPQLSTDAYSPLVVDRTAFSGGAVSAGVLRARDVPDLDRLPADRVDALAGRMAVLDALMEASVARAASGVDARTGLGTVLDQVRRLRLITAAAVTVIGSLLLVLALATLSLTTRLLAERRAGEQALMLARGASRRQLVRLAALEAALVAVGVTLAAPPLARLVYRASATGPGFAEAGLDQDPGLPPIGWLVAGGASLLFVVVLLLPLLRRPPLFVAGERARSRPGRGRRLRRSGADLGLLLLAAVAYWQLRAYGSPVTAAADGPDRLRLDPVLLVGPALALLAGALVAVRLVPVVAKGVERLAGNGRRIVPALAAWEVSRRPGRATGAVLLLTLAVAVGTFGLSYLDTWRVSQRDQADFQVGVDARIALGEIPALAQAARLPAVPGAAAAVPVVHRSAVVGSAGDVDFLVGDQFDGLPVQLLATDGRRIGALLRGRVVQPDGQDHALLDVAASMAPKRGVGGVALPGSPAELTARLRVEPIVGRSGRPAVVSVRLVLQDGRGVRQVLDLGQVSATGEAQVSRVVVPGALDPGQSVAEPGERPRLTPPLRVVAVQTDWAGELTNPVDGSLGVDSGLTIDEVAVRDVRDAATQLSAFRPIGAVPQQSWSTAGFGFFERPAPEAAPAAGTLLRARLSFDPDSQLSPTSATVVWTAWRPGTPVTGVVTEPLQRAVGEDTVGELALRTGSLGVGVDVLAVVPHLPGTDPRAPAVFVDGDALGRRLVELGATDLPLDEWWTAAPPGTEPGLVRAVEAAGGTAVTRVGLARDLQLQPLRIGIQAALWLAVLAAVVLAAVGFAAHNTVVLRSRRVEFSQLRALGVPRRGLTAVVVGENALLCLLGATFGVGLGVALGQLVAPLVGMAADGGSPVPGVVVHLPWWRIASLTAEMAGLLLLVLVGVTWADRGRSLGATLRVGDER